MSLIRICTKEWHVSWQTCAGGHACKDSKKGKALIHLQLAYHDEEKSSQQEKYKPHLQTLKPTVITFAII
jgi:hypothetical protein